MLDAVGMFKKLGYTIIKENDDYIIYSKDLFNGYNKTVIFCNQLESFSVEFNGLVRNQSPSVNVELFEAIRQQIIELNWIIK